MKNVSVISVTHVGVTNTTYVSVTCKTHVRITSTNTCKNYEYQHM